MPVINHDIHPATQKSGAEPYGCCNRKMRSSYTVQVRLYYTTMEQPDRAKYQFGLVDVPHTMSTECRHDNSLSDPGCATCKHRGSGEKYAEQVRKEGR